MTLEQLDTAAKAFRRSRDRGCEYLLRQRRSDGGIGSPDRGLADYYKAISAFQVCGETGAASQLVQWVRKYGITEEGDFGPRIPETLGYYYAYYNSWVILGAHRLEQYDLSERGMEFVLKLHEHVSGGFYSSPSEMSEEALQDLWVVCGCGRAALVTGRIDVARRVGQWLTNVMRLQPNYPAQLFGVFSRGSGLHTVPPSGEDIRYVANQSAICDQFVFNPGIAAGFLCGLHLATAENEWLELAKEYLRFASGMSDFLWKSLRTGKIGWAASLIYRLTSEQTYADMAVRVGHELLRSQLDDGSWQQFGSEWAIDITSEMVTWLDEIQQGLAA